MTDRVDVEAALRMVLPGDTHCQAIAAKIRALGAERDAAEALLFRAWDDESGTAGWVKPAEKHLTRAGLLLRASGEGEGR